jgi:hypothetical protein
MPEFMSSLPLPVLVLVVDLLPFAILTLPR